jgi:hypothetical protein
MLLRRDADGQLLVQVHDVFLLGLVRVFRDVVTGPAEGFVPAEGDNLIRTITLRRQEKTTLVVIQIDGIPPVHQGAHSPVDDDIDLVSIHVLDPDLIHDPVALVGYVDRVAVTKLVELCSVAIH